MYIACTFRCNLAAVFLFIHSNCTLVANFLRFPLVYPDHSLHSQIPLANTPTSTRLHPFRTYAYIANLAYFQYLQLCKNFVRKLISFSGFKTLVYMMNILSLWFIVVVVRNTLKPNSHTMVIWSDNSWLAITLH